MFTESQRNRERNREGDRPGPRGDPTRDESPKNSSKQFLSIHQCNLVIDGHILAKGLI